MKSPLAPITVAILAVLAILDLAPLGHAATLPAPRSMSELTSLATIKLGKTADWVSITADAVWVGSTGPTAVHRIDPKTNQLLRSVRLPGEPCAGLATGFGSLWIPLCTKTPSLAKVDLRSNKLTAVLQVGPAAAEGGVTTGDGRVWLITDKAGTLVGIDPASGAILSTFHVPPGSFNPLFIDGTLWVSRADGAELNAVDAKTGAISAKMVTGPKPRFLTGNRAAVWTLNQGDGSLTRVDLKTQKTSNTALDIPGHGGDIAVQGGFVWTTMPKIPLTVVDAATGSLICRWSGAGGDSLGLGHDAIWLTDYHAGTVSKISLEQALTLCDPARAGGSLTEPHLPGLHSPGSAS